MNNIGYLFAANMVVWIALSFYIYTLIRRNDKLCKEIESIKDNLSGAGK